MLLTSSVSKKIRSLHSRKNRERLGLALVEGSRLVQSAFDSGQMPRYIVVAESHQTMASVQNWIDNNAGSTSVFQVSDAEFAELSDVESGQGILAVISSSWSDESAVLKADTVIVFDAVQDPGNAGAIIRSAAWYGIEAIVAGPGTVDLFSPKVLRASMGGIWDVQIARVESISEFLEAFRSLGGSVFAADMSGVPHSDWSPTGKSALVFGNEGSGLSQSVQAIGPTFVSIRRLGTATGVESLNVSVAAGILLDHWRK